MYEYENLLDIVVPAQPGDTDIHTFPQFKDWINNQFVIKTDLNNPTTSYISKQSQIRSIKVKKGHSFDETHRRPLNKKLSIAYNALNQIEEGREQLQNSIVPSARGSRISNMRRASFGGGGQLGFQLREHSIMGSHSAQSSISVNGYQQINQYELTKLLGKGSFADVFLGIDVQSENSQKYAIKVLSNKKIKKRLLLKKNNHMLDRPPSPQPDQDQTSSPKQQSLADMFVRNEVAILKKVSHQYITKLHDVIVDNKQQKVYLVLDYCGGGFIGQNKDRKGQLKKLLESECKRYCKQLAQALDFIHNVAIIAHRDIKPENILLNDFDEVKLSDFGLGTHKIQGKMSAGTPLYMPPQINTEGSKQAGDIWALGVTLLVLLAGKNPQFKNQRINPQAEIAKLKDISQACRDFLSKCMEPNVQKRMKAQDLLEHKWLTSDNNLRQSLLMMSNRGIPRITVTAEEAANVISCRQDKKTDSPGPTVKIAGI